ncbi:hypothetical protein D1007_06686 [Hordeum vulgare]|nr:hypothetical protein D1007_06686 [Hordeum vulgare]
MWFKRQHTILVMALTKLTVVTVNGIQSGWWVDSDNELAKDDDDLFNEWVDTDFEEVEVVDAQGKNREKESEAEKVEKKVLPHMGTTASSVVSSTVDISNSSVLQAIATQQSQAPLPGPLPENQFIASCRDDLPPPSTRTTASTLGLKRRKVVPKTKENKVP